MERRSKYSPEVKERAVRMVFDQQHQNDSLRRNHHARPSYPLTARLTALVGLPVRDCLLVKPDRQIARRRSPSLYSAQLETWYFFCFACLYWLRLGYFMVEHYLGHHHR